MPPLFRKRQNAATASAEDEIPADLIAAIPEVDAKRKDTTPYAAVTLVEETPELDAEAWRPPPAPARHAQNPRRGAPAAAPPATPGFTPAGAPDAAEMIALVGDVRKQMEQVFARELGKVEETFTGALRQLEARLEKANAELEAARRENEGLHRVKADYDRKAEVLRELARSWEKNG